MELLDHIKVEITPCMCGQSIYDEGGKRMQWERTVSSINGSGKTGCPHMKELRRPLSSTYTQKLTEDGGKT